MCFYQITFVNEKIYKPFGVAYAPDNTDLFLLPPTGEEVLDWDPIALDLREGTFCDYLANDLGGRLCSEKLKNVIEKHKSSSDTIQWLESKVCIDGEICKDYYLLHFPCNLSVVNKESSIMVEDLVVKAVLDSKVANKYDVFSLPNADGNIWFVSKKMRNAMIEVGFTGLCFERVPMV